MEFTTRAQFYPDGARKMEAMVTYGDLFDYVIDRLDSRSCDHTVRFVKDFADLHALDFDKLAETLEHAGGYCDCQVVLNAMSRIAEDRPIQ